MKHIIIDIYTPRALDFDTIDFYEKFLRDIALYSKHKIVGKTYKEFQPYGITFCYILAESHIAVHTFPEKGLITFDFFSCKEDLNETSIIKFIAKHIKYEKMIIKTIKRGEDVS